MDKSIPTGAALLLDLIRALETGTADRSSYDVIYGHHQEKLKKQISKITIDELIKLQPSLTRRFKSSAVGGYQIVLKTLMYLKKDLRLRGNQIFSPDLQDRLAYHLLKKRGYNEFISGSITRTEFGKRLAMEWASIPVLTTTTGAKQKVRRGQSYYAGDAINRATTTPSKVEAVLNKLKLLDGVQQAMRSQSDIGRISEVDELDKHPARSKAVWTWILAAVGTVITEVGDTFGGLDWRVQLFICLAIVGLALYGIKRQVALVSTFRRITMATDKHE